MTSGCPLMPRCIQVTRVRWSLHACDALFPFRAVFYTMEVATTKAAPLQNFTSRFRHILIRLLSPTTNSRILGSWILHLAGEGSAKKKFGPGLFELYMHSTGCPPVHGNFGHSLFSGLGGRIMKPFEIFKFFFWHINFNDSSLKRRSSVYTVHMPSTRLHRPKPIFKGLCSSLAMNEWTKTMSREDLTPQTEEMEHRSLVETLYSLAEHVWP